MISGLFLPSETDAAVKTTPASTHRLSIIAGLALTLASAHAQLPPAAQRDLLELRMVDAVKTERHADFLKHLSEFRAAGGAVGAEMRYYEGVALDKTGQVLEARAAYESFIAQAGREHKLYTQALERYGALEKAARAAERQRQRTRMLLEAPLIQAMARAQQATTLSPLPRNNRWLGVWNYQWYAGERQNGLSAMPDGGWLSYGHRPPGHTLVTASIDGSWPRLDLPQLPPAALQRFGADGQSAWSQAYDFSRITLQLPSGNAGTVVAAAMQSSGHVPGDYASRGYLVPGRAKHQGNPTHYWSNGWRSEIVSVAVDAGSELRICANLQLGTQSKRAGVWAWVDARGEVVNGTAWGMPLDHPQGAVARGGRYWFDSGLDDCTVLPDGALLVAGRAVRTDANGGPGEPHKADDSLRALRIFERDGSLRDSLLLQAPAERQPAWSSPARLEAGQGSEGWVWLWGPWRIDTRNGIEATLRQPGADEAVAELLPPTGTTGKHRLRVAGRDNELIAADLVREVSLAQAGRLSDGSVMALLNLSFPKDLQATVLPDGQRLDASLWLDQQPLAVLVAFDAHGSLQWALPLRHRDKASIEAFARKAAESARKDPDRSGFSLLTPDQQIRTYAGHQGYRFSHWTELTDGRVLVGAGGGLTYALQWLSDTRAGVRP